MTYSIRTITAISAIAAIFDTAAAKLHLRIEDGEPVDDELVDALTLAAQDHIERHTSQILAPREMEITFDYFPLCDEPFCLPRAPVTAINSIKYTDVTGIEQTLGSEDFRWSESNPEKILPAFGTEWPADAACESGAVRIRFNAGYADGEVPASLESATKLVLGHLYANRESVTAFSMSELPGGVEALCRPYRRVSI